ncbi:long-chain-fatty-acid--CoA ligase [Streptomyces canus]|uniref:long-chain-fatty-acid--CoA ligase n=1 Tax=Streptomyces canus TaxID=58343 RepID=UPI0037F64605
MVPDTAAPPHDILTAVRHWATADPDAVAVRHDGQEWTRREFADRIGSVAGALHGLGVAAGDRVAFVDHNHPACLELALGCAWLGAVFVPINARLTSTEIGYIVNDATATVLFTGRVEMPEPDSLPQVRRIIALDSAYEPLLADAPTVAARRVAPEDAFLQLYTSGTTGFPKGAVLTQANVAAVSRAVTQVNGMAQHSVSLVAMPLFHVGALSQALLSLYAGATVVVVRDARPDALLDIMERQRVTHTLLVPPVLAAMVALPDARARDLSSFVGLTYGAAPMPVPLIERCRDTFNADLHQMYGCTETTGALTMLGAAEHRDLRHPGRLASAGLPLPGVELRIVDPETGKDLPVGEVGEVWVRAPHVMAGYWRRPEADDEALAGDGWLRTGDAGYIDDDSYLYMVDRVKDMIVSGGENIYPAEIERVLTEHPAVADAAVVGIPDTQWGEVGKAYVVPVSAGLDVDALVAHCRTHLAGFKCPKSFELVETLPRNATGKVLRRRLREPHWRHLERKV